MSSPPRNTLPKAGVMRPMIVFSVVVRPEPFRPRMATVSPAFMSRQTSKRMWLRP